MAINEFNRFKNNDQIIYNGVTTYGLWKRPKFLSEPQDEDNIGIYQVSASVEGRPDLIAYELYGQSELYWILIDFNKVVDVFGWPLAGTTLRYPFDILIYPELL